MLIMGGEHAIEEVLIESIMLLDRTRDLKNVVLEG